MGSLAGEQLLTAWELEPDSAGTRGSAVSLDARLAGARRTTWHCLPLSERNALLLDLRHRPVRFAHGGIRDLPGVRRGTGAYGRSPCARCRITLRTFTGIRRARRLLYAAHELVGLDG